MGTVASALYSPIDAILDLDVQTKKRKEKYDTCIKSGKGTIECDKERRYDLCIFTGKSDEICKNIKNIGDVLSKKTETETETKTGYGKYKKSRRIKSSRGSKKVKKSKKVKRSKKSKKSKILNNKIFIYI